MGRIRVAYKLANGRVVVFDRNNQRVPHLEGKYRDVKDKILKAADEDTIFCHLLLKVPKEEW